MKTNLTRSLARGTLSVLDGHQSGIRCLCAQEQTITGTVSSQTSDEPLPGVNVPGKRYYRRYYYGH